MHNLILIFVLVFCPAALWADTLSTFPDTVQSHVPNTAIAPQTLSDTTKVAQKPEGTTIISPPHDAAEAKEAQEVAAADSQNVTEEAEEEAPRIIDPLAPVNMVMYHFNDRLYFWVLKPITQVYSHIIPEDFRIMISNVYDNLWAPSRMLNNLFQLRLKAAGNELIRFLFNSFAGIGGLGDVAKDALGIKKQEADFGQTLGHYGIGHGFYIVLPVYGPSSLRDGIGLAGDHFMHPMTYVSSRHLTFWQNEGFSAHEKVNDTSFKLGDYESFKESAIDPYVSMRDAFIQYRKKKVEESKE